MKICISCLQVCCGFASFKGRQWAFARPNVSTLLSFLVFYKILSLFVSSLKLINPIWIKYK